MTWPGWIGRSETHQLTVQTKQWVCERSTRPAARGAASGLRISTAFGVPHRIAMTCIIYYIINSSIPNLDKRKGAGASAANELMLPFSGRHTLSQAETVQQAVDQARGLLPAIGPEA